MLSAKEALEQKLKQEKEQEKHKEALYKNNRKFCYSPIDLNNVLEMIHYKVKEGFIEVYGLLNEEVVENLKSLGYKIFYQCFILNEIRLKLVNNRHDYRLTKNYNWCTKVFWDDSLIKEKVKCCDYWEEL